MKFKSVHNARGWTRPHEFRGFQFTFPKAIFLVPGSAPNGVAPASEIASPPSGMIVNATSNLCTMTATWVVHTTDRATALLARVTATRPWCRSLHPRPPPQPDKKPTVAQDRRDDDDDDDASKPC